MLHYSTVLLHSFHILFLVIVRLLSVFDVIFYGVWKLAKESKYSYKLLNKNFCSCPRHVICYVIVVVCFYMTEIVTCYS